MQPIFIAALVGIILGLILIVFSLANRKKLPGWGVVVFPIIGLLILLSGVLLLLGARAL